MKKAALIPALALLAGMAGPSWVKFDQAVQLAGQSGKPICVYVAVNPDGSS